MDIKDLREKINNLDDTLSSAFKERMEVALEIARYKKENNMPVFDPARERAVVSRLTEGCDDAVAIAMKTLYSTIFDLSRSYQHRYMMGETLLHQKIAGAMENTPAVFPARASVACQGVEGAYSQQACEKLFQLPDITYFKRFEGVFQAIESGMCRYGVLPIENSSFGSVTEVYDLMRRHRFSIVRAVKVKIEHHLLALPGVKLEEIKEVVSHEQAIGQCGEFLRKHPEIQVTVCTNTAAAAKMVAESGRRDLAAISSFACAQLYGLLSIAERIADSDSNFTRFICIAKELEIYPGADKTSLMLSLPHKPGALYRMIARFSALGLNLTKLESRPIAGSDFEFMFYFDLAASVYAPEVTQLLCELEQSGQPFTYLGSYSEV